MINCPVCQGEAGKMGTLGNLTHYQCRACGMMFSVPDYGYFRGQGVQIISKASLNRKYGGKW
jgi:transposase-like protein